VTCFGFLLYTSARQQAYPPSSISKPFPAYFETHDTTHAVLGLKKSAMHKAIHKCMVAKIATGKFGTAASCRRNEFPPHPFHFLKPDFWIHVGHLRWASAGQNDDVAFFWTLLVQTSLACREKAFESHDLFPPFLLWDVLDQDFNILTSFTLTC